MKIYIIRPLADMRTTFPQGRIPHVIIILYMQYILHKLL
jgi:hypothetical protein